MIQSIEFHEEIPETKAKSMREIRVSRAPIQGKGSKVGIGFVHCIGSSKGLLRSVVCVRIRCTCRAREHRILEKDLTLCLKCIILLIRIYKNNMINTIYFY